MTWLCPGMGILLSALRMHFPSRRSEARSSSGAEVRSIVIAVPACNEERTLPRTLDGITGAITQLLRLKPEVHCTVVVGDDRSTDSTGAVARARGVSVHRSAEQRGKWSTLRSLTRLAGDAEWVVFVDSGTEWRSDTLVRLVQAAAQPGVVGVAPAYRIKGGGPVSRTVWGLERFLKGIENRAGGPVSVHGATMMYRTSELNEVFKRLGDLEFLNDDVVLPLTLRRMNRHERIVYLPDLAVTDEVDETRSERTRRHRLMIGNLQILALRERGDLVVEVLAARRLLRLFWVYWIGALILPLWGTVTVRFPAFGIAVAGAVLAALILPVRPAAIDRIVDAALASFRTPFEIVRFRREGGGASAAGARWR
ncbi:MAG: hypothetical protein RL417_921 [Pseudomonadota bacterium]